MLDDERNRKKALIELVLILAIAFSFVAGYGTGYELGTFSAIGSIGDMMSKAFYGSHIDVNLNSTELAIQINKTVMPSLLSRFQNETTTRR